MPRKEGLGRKHKKGTGNDKGHKQGRSRVNVAHPKPHSLKPIKPNDTVTPAAVAVTDPCARASDKSATVTPSAHPATPMQSPPRFNNQKIEFSAIKAAPINDDKAFRLNKKGEARTDISLRQAKSRSSQKIVHAIINAGVDDNDSSVALKSALANPKVRHIVKTVLLSDATVAVASTYVQQQQRMIARASITGKKHGRANDDQRSFCESVAVGIAESPGERCTKKKPSEREQIKLLGMKYSSGRRFLQNGMAKRKLLTQGDNTVSWSRVKPRKGFTKITPEIREKLNLWILGHPHVIQSPITNDTLLIVNQETGIMIRVPKLLIEISVRELHNDLLELPESGGLAEARDAEGKVIISDSVLRCLLPPQLRKMTARHKQMCGCEVCLTVIGMQQSLNAWRHRLLRKLKDESAASYMSRDQKLALDARITTYAHDVFRNNNTWHEKPREAIKEVQCKEVDGVGLPHWKCVLSRCSNCPTYPVPHEEKGTNDESPMIRFHVYENFSQCTIHGLLTLRAKECPGCISLADGIKKGKIGTRKHLTLLVRPIGTFMNDFYIPALLKYAYHLPHVIILGKQECGRQRHNAFENMVGSVKTRRDYAE
jgi:hypothetical protein